MEILGIDVGGTGIKGAVVNVETGEMLTERKRFLTPQPATPEAVTNTVADLVRHFDWQGTVGCGFPAVIRGGGVYTAANISKRWLGTNARDLFAEATGCTVHVANDADVAGLAEMCFGAGRGRHGVVMVLTLGTGIGSAIFVDGRLYPNTELGHLEVDGHEAEKWTSAKVRDDEKLGWKEWTKRLNVFLERIHVYLWPDLIILGGGVSKKHEKFIPKLKVDVEIVPAQMRNQAGIIGAALFAGEPRTGRAS
ncbi:MAG: ROK family protein [Myxococcota bacterium]